MRTLAPGTFPRYSAALSRDHVALELSLSLPHAGARRNIALWVMDHPMFSALCDEIMPELEVHVQHPFDAIARTIAFLSAVSHSRFGRVGGRSARAGRMHGSHSGCWQRARRIAKVTQALSAEFGRGSAARSLISMIPAACARRSTWRDLPRSSAGCAQPTSWATCGRSSRRRAPTTRGPRFVFELIVAWHGGARRVGASTV